MYFCLLIRQSASGLYAFMVQV